MENKGLTIQQFQKEVDTWIKTTGVRYFDEMTNLAVLMEEVGELSRIFSRKFGEQSWKGKEEENNLADEFTDILFVLTCLANQCDVNLEEGIKKGMEKRNNRDKNRHKNNPKLTKVGSESSSKK